MFNVFWYYLKQPTVIYLHDLGTKLGLSESRGSILPNFASKAAIITLNFIFIYM